MEGGDGAVVWAGATVEGAEVSLHEALATGLESLATAIEEDAELRRSALYAIGELLRFGALPGAPANCASAADSLFNGVFVIRVGDKFTAGIIKTVFADKLDVGRRVGHMFNAYVNLHDGILYLLCI